MEVKVSIIMGIYNCASTLRESIESILAQTYTNWEFIICDDGSSDESAEIVEEYVQNYPGRFVLLKNERNFGLNATLNKCLKVAYGEYIARQDGDDVSMPDRFEKEVNILNHHPEYAIVSCHMLTFDEKGEWGYIKTVERPEKKDYLTHVPVFCHAPCMIRREAILAVGGYTENKKFLRLEDYHLWFKLYANDYRGYNIQEPLYKMRDDRNAQFRRSAKSRLNGIYVTFVCYKMIKVPSWMYIYAVKNAIVEVIKIILPADMYRYFHRRHLIH